MSDHRDFRNKVKEILDDQFPDGLGGYEMADVLAYVRNQINLDDYRDTIEQAALADAVRAARTKYRRTGDPKQVTFEWQGDYLSASDVVKIPEAAVGIAERTAKTIRTQAMNALDWLDRAIGLGLPLTAQIATLKDGLSSTISHMNDVFGFDEPDALPEGIE